MSRSIYVASSWRNTRHREVVEALRRRRHAVYDFTDPADSHPFRWSDIDPNLQAATSSEFVAALNHPLARSGFGADYRAMYWADTCVLVLPAGRSAHLELGWAIGKQKRTAILLAGVNEPELMYKMVDYLALSLEDLLGWLERC